MMLATWFGIGRLRPAPGTLGTLAAIPFGLALQYIYGIPALIVGIIAMFALGVYVSNKYNEAEGEDDSSSIVIDEVVGIWIAGIPAMTNITLWIYAFLLFRLFDIWKPWPVSYLDREVKGGMGVMLDDVAAGVLALLGTATVASQYLYILH